MIKWYSYTPIDTMFFKGSESMEMGQDHTSTLIFPPFPETITGAVRTVYLKQKNISFDDYNKGNISKNVVEEIGEAGKEANFKVIGPFFKVDNKVYIPAPYSWFYEEENGVKCFEEDNGYESEIEIIKGKYLKSPLIKTKNSNVLWVDAKHIDNIKTLGGKWVRLEKDMFKKDRLIFNDVRTFYVKEPRTGIGIDYKNSRIVIEGHIYSFTHIRLRENVKLIFGINKDISISDNGVMSLGGEKRFGFYQLEKDIEIFAGNSGLFCTLSAQKRNENLNKSIIATGKISYVGGWDFHKRFHKPMVGLYLAGSVFKEKIDDINCIEI